jgi:hypothetical protein
MSESRRDLGPMQTVTAVALDTFARWAKYTPMQKLEIVALLQTLANIEAGRETRAEQALARQRVFDPAFGNAGIIANMQREVTDE